MTESNVSPIRAAGAAAPPRRPAKPRVRVLKLRDDTGEGDGYSTLDVVNGLQGVCVAIDDAAATRSCADVENVACLAMAAKVLSTIVKMRVEL